MNPAINNFNLKELKGRDARLFQEWKELDSLCDKRRRESANPRQPSLSYIIPRKPIFGNLHKMSVVLPNNYPSADGNPVFTFITDIWHPNIRNSGSFKGHVCLTIKEMGVLASIKDLVLRVERYLKYQMYHAQNTYPYPEDQGVAEWVREEGEPNGWTKFAQDKQEPSKPAATAPGTQEDSQQKKKISLSI